MGSKLYANPMLIGAMELLKAEPTREHKLLFFEELVKSRFLTPVTITPPPQADEKGRVRITDENQIQVPMLSSDDGRHFFMAFTDKGEMRLWNKKEYQQTFSFGFREYAGMVLREGAKSDGFVINPYSIRLIVDKEMIQAICASQSKK